MRATTASRSARSASTPRAGTARWSRRERRTASRCGSACAWSRASANADAARSSPRARSALRQRRRALAARRRAVGERWSTLAEADAFRPSLGLARREALWAIKALRDEPLPLFAAAVAREAAIVAGDRRARGGARPMTAGGEVVRGLWPCRPHAARPPGRLPARRSRAPAHRLPAPRRCEAATARSSASPASCWCARCRARPRA